MQIGYIRVSKNDGSQVFDLQQDALVESGVDSERIYKDQASGRRDDRPGLQACLKALQPGNTLVVWKLDRLGRSLKHLVSIVDDLNNREIGFKVLAGTGAQINTTTSNGRLVFGIFAAIAMEIAQISPPIGVNLFTIHGISGIGLWKLARGALPFLFIQIVMLYMVYLFPQIVLWLPQSTR